MFYSKQEAHSATSVRCPYTVFTVVRNAGKQSPDHWVLCKESQGSRPFSKPMSQPTTALGKTSIAVHQWTAKQFWVDRQSFKQED